MLRFPKGGVAPELPSLQRIGTTDVLSQPRSETPDVLVVAVGAMAACGVEVAERIREHGLDSTVVDPRWVKPVDRSIVELASRHRMVVVVEDSGEVGGVCSAVRQSLAEAGVFLPVLGHGIRQEFLDHASRAQVLQLCGLTARDVARSIVETASRLAPADLPPGGMGGRVGEDTSEDVTVRGR